MTGRLGTKAYLITQLEDLRATPRMISTGSSFAFVSSQDKISGYLIFNVILTSTDRRSRWTCPSQSGNWAGRGQSLGRPLGNALPWLFNPVGCMLNTPICYRLYNTWQMSRDPKTYTDLKILLNSNYLDRVTVGRFSFDLY